MGSLVCVNGAFYPAEEAKIPVFDRGVLYGMGLFETIKVSGGVPVRSSLHISRLAASAKDLSLELPFNKDTIIQMLESTAKVNNISEGALRLTLTGGGVDSAPMLFITTRELPVSKEAISEGVRVGLSGVKKNKASVLVRHKTLNYFENIIARQQATHNGWYEAIMQNNEGYITEGSASNIFLIKNGRLITPNISCGLLPGIIRGLVIKHCALDGKPIEEKAVRPDELLSADEIFITNSLIGILPVISVNNALIGDGKPGKLTKKLLDANLF